MKLAKIKENSKSRQGRKVCNITKETATRLSEAFLAENLQERKTRHIQSVI